MGESLDLDRPEVLVEWSRHALARNAEREREWARRTRPGRELTREEALSGVRPEGYEGYFNPCRVCGVTIPFGEEYYSDFSLPGDVFGICVSCHRANLRACQDCGKLLRPNHSYAFRGHRCYECWSDQAPVEKASLTPSEGPFQVVLAMVAIAILTWVLVATAPSTSANRCTVAGNPVITASCP